MDDFALIHALLPAAPIGSAADDGDDAAPAPESLRSYILALMAVLYAQALSQVESISQERSLLESVPDDLDDRRADDRRARERDEVEDVDRSWKLDRVNRGGPDGKGPLMDPSGKVRSLLRVDTWRGFRQLTLYLAFARQPMRPFTILPSGGEMDDRERLQSEVFRAGHRLPTMSIDDYLKNEWDTGRVITGGGCGFPSATSSFEGD